MTAYDEEQVLGRYMVHHLGRLMTDFERRCYRLGVMREKAEASPSSRVAERLRAAWPEADTDVPEALSDGVTALCQRIVNRVRREHGQGTLRLNRCPRCHRIARTPLAKQCFCCGHDWHSSPQTG
jgi:hypothetical protein